MALQFSDSSVAQGHGNGNNFEMWRANEATHGTQRNGI